MQFQLTYQFSSHVRILGFLQVVPCTLSVLLFVHSSYLGIHACIRVAVSVHLVVAWYVCGRQVLKLLLIFSYFTYSLQEGRQSVGFAPTGCVATGACLPLSALPEFLIYLFFLFLIPNLEPTGRGARSNGWRRYRGESPPVGPPVGCLLFLFGTC